MTTPFLDKPAGQPGIPRPPIQPASPPTDDKRKDRRLGRGLASLITMPSAAAPAATPADHAHALAAGAPGESHRVQATVVNVELADIEPNPHQPRRTFDAETLASLADSIRVNGLVQPILLRRRAQAPASVPGQPEGPRYQLVAGERRWRAAKLAGLTAVSAIVRSLDDDAMLELALVENIQRADLNPMERAAAYEALMRRRHIRQDELAQRLGESRGSVSNYLRLLELPEEVRQLVASGQVSFGHAKAIMSFKRPESQIKAARATAEFGWSVRDLEQLVGAVAAQPVGEGGLEQQIAQKVTKAKPAPKPEPPPKPANIRTIEEKLTQRLGTRVEIRQGRRADMGKLIIDFYCLDDFDRVLEALGVVID